MFNSKSARVLRGVLPADKPFVIDPLRPSKRMLLGTSYGINKSCTATVAVGHALVGQRFEPIIQLHGHGGSIVAMRAAIWYKFLDVYHTITQYLAEPSTTVSTSNIASDTAPVELDGYTVSFIHAHGLRAIKLTEQHEMWMNEEDRTTDDESSMFPEPSAKRRKLYSPSIVMQKPSIDGLAAVIPCINDHLSRLSDNVTAVNQCKDDVVRELATLANAFGFVDTPLKRFTELVMRDFDEARGILRIHFNPHFAEDVYNIVTLELKAQFTVEIAKEIKAVIDSTREYRR